MKQPMVGELGGNKFNTAEVAGSVAIDAQAGYLQKFIDEYLRLRMYDLHDANRAIVAQGIELFADGGAVVPSELTVFLDNLYRLHHV